MKRRCAWTPTGSGSRRANMANTFWLFVTFDTDGEVSFAGIGTITNRVFRLILKVNDAYFRLRYQYRSW
jgi:hypothetical protein